MVFFAFGWGKSVKVVSVLRLGVFMSWGLNLTLCQIGHAFTSRVRRRCRGLVGEFVRKGVALFG